MDVDAFPVETLINSFVFFFFVFFFLGAAAMAGAVTHTISTSVIVFELTGEFVAPVCLWVVVTLSTELHQGRLHLEVAQ